MSQVTRDLICIVWLTSFRQSKNPNGQPAAQATLTRFLAQPLSSDMWKSTPERSWAHSCRICHLNLVHVRKKARKISSSSSENVSLYIIFSTPHNIFFQNFPQNIDELVDEWILAQRLSAVEESGLAAVPIIASPNGPEPKLVSTGKTAINLASYNFTGLGMNT